jgi:D-arabinose 1-dehydrogenase-like Zn-dependent alcohol dehydrogenase
MSDQYRAVEVTSPGVLRLVERRVPEPGRGQVRVRVQAAGICHTDALIIEGYWPNVPYPHVPGHEIAGFIEAVGDGVLGWKRGQRVGVGWFGGNCGRCESCRRGDLINCANLIATGVSKDGGYAEVVIVEASALAAIPDQLAAEDAAPLLCAGVTTYNALRNANLRAGDLVAVQGIGGLGHLAVQFARGMGFRVVAIARGKEKEELARKLGAHEYIDSTAEDPAQALLRLGGADAILATASSGKSMGPLLGGLANRGKLIVAGVSDEPMEVNLTHLIAGSKTIQAQTGGTAIDSEDTLDFSVLQRIRPVIERVPLEKAPEAYARMMRNEARFRMVVSFEGVRP